MQRINSLASCLAIAAQACDSPTTAARFSEATPQQIEHALLVASAEDAALGTLAAVWSAGRSDPTGCPAVQTSGATTIVSWSCDSGLAGGMFTASNVRSSPAEANPAYDRSLPSHVLFQQFLAKAFLIEGSVVDTITRVVDGTVDWHPAAGTIDIVLGVTDNDVHSFADLHFRCGAAGLCSASGSTIWVEGLGSAAVTGGWAFDAPYAGTLDLSGEDRIEFDMAMDGADRVTYAIDRGSSTPVDFGTNRMVFLDDYP